MSTAASLQSCPSWGMVALDCFPSALTRTRKSVRGPRIGSGRGSPPVPVPVAVPGKFPFHFPLPLTKNEGAQETHSSCNAATDYNRRDGTASAARPPPAFFLSETPREPSARHAPALMAAHRQWTERLQAARQRQRQPRVSPVSAGLERADWPTGRRLQRSQRVRVGEWAPLPRSRTRTRTSSSHSHSDSVPPLQTLPSFFDPLFLAPPSPRDTLPIHLSQQS